VLNEGENTEGTLQSKGSLGLLEAVSYKDLQSGETTGRQLETDRSKEMGSAKKIFELQQKSIHTLSETFDARQY